MARRRQPRCFQMQPRFPWTKLAARPWFPSLQLSYQHFRTEGDLAWLYHGHTVQDTYRPGFNTPSWAFVLPGTIQET